jgi:mannose-6-phosphate isomerase-like protein (cupin superfamily)
MKVIDTAHAEHYQWGREAEGWHLLRREDLSVIQERVPSGIHEVRHYHKEARQFFYILSGEAVIEIAGEVHMLQAGQGIEAPPKTPHQFRNESNAEVVFLVISAPKAHGDRVEM